jgi:hypothetical protein
MLPPLSVDVLVDDDEAEEVDEDLENEFIDRTGVDEGDGSEFSIYTLTSEIRTVRVVELGPKSC